MMKHILISLVVVCPLLIGTDGPCSEPTRPRLEDCPFPVDPNQVQGVLLGWIEIQVGERLTHTRTWCDPDGDSALAEITSGPEDARLVNKPKVNAYTILWTPKYPTTAAIVVRVTDRPDFAPPKSSVGTLLVRAVTTRKHTARGSCGGQPPS